MAIQEEYDQVMPRIPGGSLVPSGTYVCVATLGPTGTIAYTQTTSDGVLPSIDFWHLIPTGTVSGSASASTIASGLNTTLNATGLVNSVSPIAGGYAYTSASIAAWVSGDAPQSKGLGAQDA